MVDTKAEHGYWGIRGLGAMSRLTAAAAGADINDVKLTDQQKWKEEQKKELDTHLPNLPYLKVDGVVITEHDAIVRYIATKWKPELLGATPAEKALVEQYFTALVKCNGKFRSLHFKKDPVATEEELEKSVEEHATLLDAINKRLADHKWIVSENVSIVDIYFHEVHLGLTVSSKAAVEKREHFKRWLADFEKEQWYVDYVASGNWIEKPLYPPAFAALNYA